MAPRGAKQAADREAKAKAGFGPPPPPKEATALPAKAPPANIAKAVGPKMNAAPAGGLPIILKKTKLKK